MHHMYGDSGRSGAIESRHSPMNAATLPSLAIITFYLGGILPWFSNYWVESCSAQHAGIDCIVVMVTGVTALPGLARVTNPTKKFDCRPIHDALPGNVIVLEISGGDFLKHFSDSTGYKLHALPNELDLRKMAEFKPLYGSLLMAHSWRLWGKNYSHWGWSDVDLILGDVWGLTAGLGSTASQAPDLWCWYFEGGWGPPHIAGQLGVARNADGVLNLWRHQGPGLADIFASPDYKEFDERGYGDIVFKLSSTAPAATAAPVSGVPMSRGFVDDEGHDRPLRVSAVLNGAYADMLAVCGADGRRWRYWWDRGHVWGVQCGNETKYAAAPREGAYFHFMCAKW
jgi:hypothetical protein